MAGNKDWIPEKIKEFDDFQSTFCTDVNTNVVAWHINTAKNTTLQDFATVYNDFYAISKLDATARKIDYDNTEAARKDLKKYIRLITKQEIKNNTFMTDEDRTTIGVPNAPAAAVDAAVSEVSPALGYMNVARLIGKYSFTPKKKPVGQGGYRIKTGFYKAGGTVPTEAQCTQSDVIVGTKDVILYDEMYLGMLFVSYTRYLNTAKKLGKAATVYYGVVS